MANGRRIIWQGRIGFLRRVSVSPPTLGSRLSICPGSGFLGGETDGILCHFWLFDAVRLARLHVGHTPGFHALDDGRERRTLGGNFFGVSPLTPIFYEIQQLIESNIHN